MLPLAFTMEPFSDATKSLSKVVFAFTAGALAPIVIWIGVNEVRDSRVQEQMSNCRVLSELEV